MDSTFSIEIYGSPVLREKARPVGQVDESIRRLAREMLVTMYAAEGIGLAAQQVGHTESICMVDISPRLVNGESLRSLSDPVAEMPLVLVNPVIGEMTGKEKDREGCLSFPEIFVEIGRAREITVEYLALDGHAKSLRAMGLLARAIQHEVDHLNGILLVDRMSFVQKTALSGSLKRLRRRGAPA